MSEHGWHEGRNIVIDVRWAEGDMARVPALAADLVRSKPHVIVTAANPVISAVKKATQSIPIVMATGSDPVSAGLVASLVRPGGNITGVTGFYESTPAKMVEVASALVPRGAKVAAVFERNTLFSQPRYRDQFARTVESVGLRPDIYEVATPGEVKRLPGILAAAKPAAIVFLPGPMIFALRDEVVVRAESLAVPVVYPFEEMAEAGGLLSYAPNLLDSYRAAARYVDRIVRGANPADLPIEQPTRLWLAVNMRTARSRGIQIPESIRQRVDRIIE